MAKKSHSHSHNHSHHHYHFWLILLAIVAVIVAYRFFSHQDKWSSYVVETREEVQGMKTENSVEDAKLIATGIVGVPGGNASILGRPAALQSYIETISSETKRDVVIVSNDLEVIASTESEINGKVYDADEKGEVKMTIADGQVRRFVERSITHPDGIERTVISFKDQEGSVVGAIILSNSQIFE